MDRSSVLHATLPMMLIGALLGTSCSSAGDPGRPAAIPERQVPVYSYRIVATFPHDPKAFTQGLAFGGGALYEGTGQYGRSSLRKVDLDNGRVLQQRDLPDRFHGEGVTLYEERLIQLTWRARVGLVYERDTLEPVGEFDYHTEGWGLTHDGRRLIMSDGTANLYFLDPDTFLEIGRLEVRDGNVPVPRLNELEFVEGEIYANVWQTERIARIAPASGQVLGWIDLQGLLPPEERRQVDVLNGIAYDTQARRLFVTGKWWPKLFEIELQVRGD